MLLNLAYTELSSHSIQSISFWWGLRTRLPYAPSLNQSTHQKAPSIAKKLSFSGCFARSASQGLQQLETSHNPSFKLPLGVPHVNRNIESTKKEVQANCGIGFLAPLVCGIDGVPQAFLSD